MSTSIKDNYLYPLYVKWLEKSSKKRCQGEVELLSISQEYFFEFKFRYEANQGFRDKQNRLYKSVLRDLKIIQILDDKFNRNI